MQQADAARSERWTVDKASVNAFVTVLSFGIYLGELGLASFFQEQQKK